MQTWYLSVFATVLDLVELEAPRGRVEPSVGPLIRNRSRRSRPVFVECLNQVGIVSGNTFLRRDRHPADDTDFWAGGNPNTGGFWKPLGREVLRPLDPGAGEAQETVARRRR